MQITKLEINRYKNLRSFRETFERGVNLIKGPNEAGKSSLLDAITDLFFSDSSSARKELKEKVGWDSEKSFELIMEFAIEGEIYRLRKDFENGETSLLKQSNGEEIDDRKRILEVIESGLGMANQDIYLATTTIRQNEISRVSKSSEAIKDKLEGLITSGREEILASQALGKIEEKIHAIKKEGNKHFGVIQKLEKNRDELIYELDKAKREIDLVAKNRLKLRETQTLLEGIRIEYTAKKSHMEKAAKAAANEERLKDLEEKFQDLNNRVKSIQNSERIITDLKKEISEYPEIDPTDLRQAEDQTAQLRYLDGKRENAEAKLDELAEKVALAKPSVILKVSAMFMLLVSIASGLYWGLAINMSDNRFIFGAAAGMVFFAILTIFWGKKAGYARGIKLQYNLKKNSLEEIESDLENSKVSVDTILEKYVADNVATLKNKYEHHRDLDKEIKNEVRRYDSWLDGHSLSELQKNLNSVTKDLAVETENARELRGFSLQAEDAEKLNVLVDALEKQKTSLEATEISLKRQLEFAESGCELQASLEERLEDIESDIRRVQHQLKIYEIIKTYIEKARKNVLKASIGVLEQETSQVLEKVTSGKYDRVRFDRQSLRFEVYSPEKDDWIDPDKALSQGTRDQLYLAARFALVRIISQDRKPVLIFDEPFLSFDPQRRSNAMEILSQYAENYQIFILTCHSYYDNIAERKIDLDYSQQSEAPVMAQT